MNSDSFVFIYYIIYRRLDFYDEEHSLKRCFIMVVVRLVAPAQMSNIGNEIVSLTQEFRTTFSCQYCRLTQYKRLDEDKRWIGLHTV